MTIYKYDAPVRDSLMVQMPSGAQVLTVQMQHGEPYFWALVDPNESMMDFKFKVRGTGHNADGLGRYVGTIQMDGGGLVFHYFEAV